MNMPAVPAVAVITRTKNRPKMLERAFASVLGQSVGDWVHVVVNDGGDPAPVDALAERYREAYAGRLQVIHNPESLGMEAASNVGIARSHSRFIVIHDDDDSWEPTFLEETAGFLEQSAGRYHGVVTQAWRIVEDAETLEEQERGLVPPVDNITAATLVATNLFPPIAFLFERAAYAEVGPFREGFPVLGDWEFNIRFVRRFDIGVLPRPLARWHHRPASADAATGNSIFAAADKHAAYRGLLRNELLREDLAGGRTGLGVLAGVGSILETLLLVRDGLLRDEIRQQIGGRDEKIEALHRQIEGQIGDILNHQQQARDRDALIGDLHRQLEARIGELQSLQRQAEAWVGDLRRQIEERDDVIRTLHRQLEDQIRLTDEVNRALRERLPVPAWLRGSLPYRATRSLARRLFGLRSH
ncbi:glycosyltransferase family 2 protein [Azospirillum soli]|uniref:glycosyltransferase family 2 protein n=1 Tax=Azospirillum soli TaxID=1304799 RepID=UPI001AE46E22|nr:glycosyltransferase [Azospirillum soli]MBP2316092.1 glycosyltransferase involved in cell wall biosynthesis [Azospirillum soli]